MEYIEHKFNNEKLVKTARAFIDEGFLKFIDENLGAEKVKDIVVGNLFEKEEGVRLFNQWEDKYYDWTNEDCFVKPSIYEQSNIIIKAPTGSGKTTALLEYIKEKQLQSVIVAPLIALGNQITEGTDFEIVNSENKIKSIKEDLKEHLENGKTVVITFQSLINNHKLLKDYPIYIDEAHMLIEYSEYMGLYYLIYIINKGHFENLTMITATPMGLNLLFSRYETVKAKVKPRYQRYVDLWKGEQSTKNILGFLLHMLDEKRADKLLVLVQNKATIKALQAELEIRNISTAKYTADDKEISIVNEKFSKDVKVVLCTSSLTTGVSIKEDFHSIYIMEHHDTINTIPQFFARNRSRESYCTILKGKYNLDKKLPTRLKISHIDNENLFGATRVNKKLEDYLNETLKNLKYNINPTSLEYYLGNEEYYVHDVIGEANFSDTQLLSSAVYLEKVNNPREYFTNNETPNFRRSDSPYLDRMYQLWNVSNYGTAEGSRELKEVYRELIGEHAAWEWGSREKFYDLFYNEIRDVKRLEALKLTVEVSLDSIDRVDFRKQFSNKEYSKKEFKEYCIKNYHLNKKLFKNQKVIETFLARIDFKIVKKSGIRYLEEVAVF